MNVAEKEVWAEIPNTRGAYQASSTGRIRSMDRRVRCRGKYGGWATRMVRGKILRPCSNPKGYMMVSVNMDGVARSRCAHALILMAFHGPRPDGHECRHLNGDPGDNRLSNLAWGTRRENSADTTRHGTRHIARWGRCGTGKLTLFDVAVIHARLASGEAQISIAKDYGMTEAGIGDVNLGRSWSYV